MDLVAVPHKLVYDLLLGGNRRDVLARHLAQPLDHPLGAPVEGEDEGAVADGRVRASEDEVVGHVGAGKRDVGFGLAGPFLAEASAGAADDGEVGDLANVEAGGTDEDVERVGHAVGGMNSGFTHVGNGAVGQMDVGACERFEVAVARCDSAAAKLPFWNQLLAQNGVVIQFRGHLFPREFSGVEIQL